MTFLYQSETLACWVRGKVMGKRIKPGMFTKELEAALNATGLPWKIETGLKHAKIMLGGRLACVIGRHVKKPHRIMILKNIKDVKRVAAEIAAEGEGNKAMLHGIRRMSMFELNEAYEAAWAAGAITLAERLAAEIDRPGELYAYPLNLPPVYGYLKDDKSFPNFTMLHAGNNFGLDEKRA